MFLSTYARKIDLFIKYVIVVEELKKGGQNAEASEPKREEIVQGLR